MSAKQLSLIDELAVKACRLMTEQERQEFFSYQEERVSSGNCYNAKYRLGHTYYKGARKGEERDVFEIDGHIFNKLWETVHNYAYLSARSSHGKENDDVFDDVQDICAQTFYVLRFFGPTPSNTPFSRYFPLICANVLSTSARRRFGTAERTVVTLYKAAGGQISVSLRNDFKDTLRLQKFFEKNNLQNVSVESLQVSGTLTIPEGQLVVSRFGAKSYKTKVNYSAKSLFEDVVNSDEDSLNLIDVISNDNSHNYGEFWGSIPESEKFAVSLLVQGASLTEVSRVLNIRTKVLRERIESIVTEFYGADVVASLTKKVLSKQSVIAETESNAVPENESELIPAFC